MWLKKLNCAHVECERPERFLEGERHLGMQVWGPGGRKS